MYRIRIYFAWILKMGNRKEIQDQHELAILNEYINWLNSQSDEEFKIIERPDPPDAIIKGNDRIKWLEHTDAYRSPEEAQEERSLVTLGEKPFHHKEHPIISPDERFAGVVVNNLHSKLQKDSYKVVYEKYGQGTLIVSERDPLFGSDTLNDIRTALNSYVFVGDRGYFKQAYLCIRANGGYIFEEIYNK
jgi:hypothetical protein